MNEQETTKEEGIDLPEEAERISNDGYYIKICHEYYG